MQSDDKLFCVLIFSAVLPSAAKEIEFNMQDMCNNTLDGRNRSIAKGESNGSSRASLIQNSLDSRGRLSALT